MTEKLLKELNEKMQAVENLPILQLIQSGATAKQIEDTLKVKSVSPTNLAMSFSIKKLKGENAKTE